MNTNMKMRTGRKHVPRVPVTPDNEWAVVVEIWYTFPGKINVYWNEAFVPPAGRRDQITVKAAPGANYFHPGSRTISFVVKGAKPSDRVKLRLLKVLQVNLVVAQTFDTFFEDNNVDPASTACDAPFARTLSESKGLFSHRTCSAVLSYVCPSFRFSLSNETHRTTDKPCVFVERRLHCRRRCWQSCRRTTLQTTTQTAAPSSSRTSSYETWHRCSASILGVSV